APTRFYTLSLHDALPIFIGSGLFIIVQFALFLLVGTSLWLAGADQPGMRGDAIYPTFIVTHLPGGIAGLAVGGILAAAMSSHARSEEHTSELQSRFDLVC